MANKVVSLDIGTSSIKAIEAIVRKNDARITRAYVMPLESEIIEPGEILSPELLISALVRLWREARFSTRNVYVLAQGFSKSWHRQVEELEWVRDEDLAIWLPHGLPPKLPSIDLSQFYVGAHTFEQYYVDNNRFRHIWASGVEREYVDTLMAVLDGAKLKPLKVDVLPYALVRSYEVNRPRNAERNLAAMIDVGALETSIVIHENGQPTFIYAHPLLGGRRVTERIAQALGVTLPEAEYLKVALSTPEGEQANLNRRLGLNPIEAQTLQLDRYAPEQLQSAAAIISQEVTNWVEEIRNTLRQAGVIENYDEEFDLSKIVLSGGGSKLQTLLPRLSGELDVPVELADPFERTRLPRVQPEIAYNHQAYAGAYGLLVGENA